MKVLEVIAELERQYPGKNIIQLPPNNPTEIICEVDPTSKHHEYNLAIAIIDQSEPHFHHEAVETYKILAGKLVLNIDGHEFLLEPGDVRTVQPGEVHFATGDAAWVEVTSTPGWTPEDHILIHQA